MFRVYIYSFRFLAAAIVLAIKCGTALLTASRVPRIAVFAAVVNMAFVAYLGRSDPIISRIPNPPYLYLLIAKHLFFVYNHNGAAKRAVISVYCLRVNRFNLRNPSNSSLAVVFSWKIHYSISFIKSSTNTKQDNNSRRGMVILVKGATFVLVVKSRT